MTTPGNSSPPLAARVLLLVLQVLQVALLGCHDLVPLGSLDDVAAVRRELDYPALVRTTLLQGLPWTVGLAASAMFFHAACPGWLWWWLKVSYAVLLVGELRAW